MTASPRQVPPAGATSSGSADPLNTRLTKSRTMAPMTWPLGLRGPVHVGAFLLV